MPKTAEKCEPSFSERYASLAVLTMWHIVRTALLMVRLADASHGGGQSEPRANRV